MKITGWLIYRAGTNKMRTVTMRPRLAFDEIAWRLTIDVPSPWGKILHDVELSLPDDVPPSITAADPVSAEDNPEVE